MIEGIQQTAVSIGLMDETSFNKGIKGLYRTAHPDGVFCTPFQSKSNQIMNVTEIPFNHYIGIKESNQEKYLLMLDKSDNQLNHLGTMHASAQFSLAEATVAISC
jgi:hypothetical protein